MALEFKDLNDAEINQEYNPPDKIQADRKRVYERYQKMKNGRNIRGADITKLWDKWEKQYESWRPPKKYIDEWQSNIVPPFTTTIVERALAEIVGQTVRPAIRGRGEEDKDKAKILEHIVDYSWYVGDGDLELFDSLKQCLVLGKTIWQEDYRLEEREVQILKGLSLKEDEREFNYVKKNIIDFNDVYGENVSLRNFFIDPAAKTINRGRYRASDCIRRYILSYDSFMEMFKGSIWDQFGDTDKVRPGARSDFYQYYEPSRGVWNDEVELLFYWSRTPDKMIIVANDVVIRDDPNPYNHKQLPFAEGSDVTRLDGFYARGEPELLESIQDELTTLRRMRIDRTHMDIFKPTFISNRELLGEDENILHPGAMIPVDDPSSVKELNNSDINPSAYREEALLKEDGREVTGVMNPQPSGTATEAAIFKESTMKTLQLKLWRLSRELVGSAMKLRVPNIVQYYDAPNVASIVGDASEYRRIVTEGVRLDIDREGNLMEQDERGYHFFDVKPGMVTPKYGGFDLVITAEPELPLSKPLRQDKISEFMQHPVIVQAVQNGYYDVNKMADTLSEEFEYDPEEFKQPEAPQEPMVDEEQILELANRENEIMLGGRMLPGTPYAPQEHTQVHLAFLSSPTFAENMNEDAIAAFTRHILEEARAQEARQSGGQPKAGLGQPMAGPGQQKGSEIEGIMGSKLKSAAPGRMIGKERVPGGAVPEGGTTIR